MIEVELTKFVKCSWTVRAINKIVRSSIVDKKIKGIIEVNVVGEQRIKTINRKYRGLDKTTDVLAFAFAEDKTFMGQIAGQLFICLPVIKKQSNRFRVSLKEEFIRMLVHGLLHLQGFDHQKVSQADIMFALQEKIVEKVKKIL